MPMLILDTDHLSEFERGLAAGERLADQLNASGEEAAITIVSVEEQLCCHGRKRRRRFSCACVQAAFASAVWI